MKYLLRINILGVVIVCITSISLIAQIKRDAIPKSVEFNLNSSIETKILSNIDVNALINEDNDEE